jgi:hypothetical protein
MTLVTRERLDLFYDPAPERPGVRIISLSTFPARAMHEGAAFESPRKAVTLENQTSTER